MDPRPRHRTGGWKSSFMIRYTHAHTDFAAPAHSRDHPARSAQRGARLGTTSACGPTWLILPTYNEVENLEPLVEAVLPVLAEASPGGHRILVVDDNSPDGTGR